MSYGRAVQVEHTERLEACKVTSIFVLLPPTRTGDDGKREKKVGRREKEVGIGKEEDAP